MFWILIIILVANFIILLFIVSRLSAQLNERFNQTSQLLQESSRVINANLGNTTLVFGNIKEQLGRLEETNRNIVEISRDISSLQELLKAPKFRGAIGEVMLENLLSQILPGEHFEMQYRFKGQDAVDAVIKVGNKLVPVDAKFSLDNFQKSLDAQDEQLRASFLRKFIQDVKNRIDEVSSKYILPQENTYDFALMYIPAENVFYEVIIKEDIFSYGILKKVIPVSPNTFYAYLQVICLGLKGLRVEENAKNILKSLSALNVEIGRFKDDFNTLGGHIVNAGTKYSEAQKRLDRFSEKLQNIQQ